MDSRGFEELACRVMAEHYGVRWDAAPHGLIKKFDMVSLDRQVIGDAKYYSLVNGTKMPPAKLSTIAEHVWLLEKIPARHRFLVFGNQIEVPQMWLQRYGHLCPEIEFYFLDNDGALSGLNS
jgi:hypothetical protein